VATWPRDRIVLTGDARPFDFIMYRNDIDVDSCLLEKDHLQ
jgi:hypothetical protein